MELRNITFTSLVNWSVQYLLEATFSYNPDYKLVPIGKFLTRNKTPINIEDGIEYKRVTIRGNNLGVYLRDKEKGENIGTKKQFVIKKDQFLVSKIDARNGAFGVIPDEVDGAIITGNFWTFDVDASVINPHFLSLIVTTPEFVRFCENASNGTTNRHYLQEDLFLAQPIPLPSLPEQNRIVAEYNQKIQLAEQQEKEAALVEEHLLSSIDVSLGIETLQNITNYYGSYLKTVSYDNLNKWGIDLMSNTQISYSKNYQVLKVIQICSVGSGGTPSRSRKDYYNGDIPWIKTGEVVNDVIYNTEEKITQEAIDNSSAKLYPKDSLIVAMYGQGKTRGRTAKLGVEATTNQACAVLYDINSSIISTDYLWVYLQNEYFRLRELASGNSQPNLNAEMIKNYPVVIPPLSIQKSIIDRVFSSQKQIKKLKENALKNKEEALLNFEKEIFSS